jgi:hypothetical protein
MYQGVIVLSTRQAVGMAQQLTVDVLVALSFVHIYVMVGCWMSSEGCDQCARAAAKAWGYFCSPAVRPMKRLAACGPARSLVCVFMRDCGVSTNRPQVDE